MAQNITVMGASYSDVPSVELPKTGGGTAQFDDTTDANATAADIAQGKTAYVNGSKITGTGSGGGYTIDDIVSNNITDSNVYLPTATKIYPYTFYGKSITGIDAPNVTTFSVGGDGMYVFANCTSLVNINLPNLTSMGSGGYQFSGCTSLVTVHLPKCTAGQYMFNGCTKLETAVLGGTGNLNGNGFRGCSKLKVVDAKTQRVYNNEFYNCTVMNKLILRKTDGVATLYNTNAFSGTPFASGKSGGTLYVPEDLIDAYKKASNWSTILGYANNSIESIEDSIYETKYADGTDV